MALGHIELRKRNEAFNKKAGTITTKADAALKREKADLNELSGGTKTKLPTWALAALCFCVFGGIIFQSLQSIVEFMGGKRS